MGSMHLIQILCWFKRMQEEREKRKANYPATILRDSVVRVV